MRALSYLVIVAHIKLCRNTLACISNLDASIHTQSHKPYVTPTITSKENKEYSNYNINVSKIQNKINPFHEGACAFHDVDQLKERTSHIISLLLGSIHPNSGKKHRK